MEFIISNVNENNKYKGTYAKIFDILNSERIFVEVYETENSKGLIGNEYHLEISEEPSPNIIEKIIKLKNVKIK